MNTEVMIQHPEYGFVRFNGKPKIPVHMAGREILRPVPQCLGHARLTRGFKKIFGCTVFEYLRKERLAYGRLLLAENKLSITQVAFEAGFCSSSHFASAFHKQFGISPSAFRTGHQT